MDSKSQMDVKKEIQLDRDELELQANGHIQELPRQFTLFSLMGFAFALMCSWVGMSATLGVYPFCFFRRPHLGTRSWGPSHGNYLSGYG